MRCDGCFLHGVVPLRDSADGQVGVYSQGCCRFIDDYRWLVTGVAIAQHTRRQVEHTDEECDEEVVLVVFGKGVVHCRDDAVWLGLTCRDVAEQGSRDGHA